MRGLTVKTTEAETTSMQQEKKVPMRGTASEVGGLMSATMERKKQTERRIVISSVIFSHASGGIVKPGMM